MTAEIKETLKLETGQIRTMNHPKYGENLQFLVQARDIVDRGRIPCAEVFAATCLGGWNWKFLLPDVFIIVQQNAKKFIAINEEIVIN